MKTSFIKFCQQYNDPVWGLHAVTWFATPLIRVTRNRLGKAVFEWVGNAQSEVNLEVIKKHYPLAIYPEVY